MKAHRCATRPAPSGAVRFDERLSVPWWWWIVALLVVGLVDISVRIGHPGVPSWLPVAALVPLAAVALVRLGRRRITLTVSDAPDGEAGTGTEAVLRVGEATLPTRFVADAAVVAPRDKQAALGPELDGTAFVLHRPWVGPMVRVTLNDPADPTPYWLFSSRRAEALVECLRTSRPG